MRPDRGRPSARTPGVCPQHRPGARRPDGRQRSRQPGTGLVAAGTGLAHRLAPATPAGARHLPGGPAPGGGCRWMRRRAAGGSPTAAAQRAGIRRDSLAQERQQKNRCWRGKPTAAWCCTGMEIASACRKMPPCWVPHCTAPNRCFASAAMPSACNATWRSTVRCARALDRQRHDYVVMPWGLEALNNYAMTGPLWAPACSTRASGFWAGLWIS